MQRTAGACGLQPRDRRAEGAIPDTVLHRGGESHARAGHVSLEPWQGIKGKRKGKRTHVRNSGARWRGAKGEMWVGGSGAWRAGRCFLILRKEHQQAYIFMKKEQESTNSVTYTAYVYRYDNRYQTYKAHGAHARTRAVTAPLVCCTVAVPSVNSRCRFVDSGATRSCVLRPPRRSPATPAQSGRCPER